MKAYLASASMQNYKRFNDKNCSGVCVLISQVHLTNFKILHFVAGVIHVGALMIRESDEYANHTVSHVQTT